ncbi:hypothetical protein TK78_00150 [Streptomyces sp. Tue 6075]|nr:hypothetical protein TK78_00150 [Streptomyces sp. Tue 6075]
MPTELARDLFARRSRLRGQYLGAVISNGEMCTLILPPNSRVGMDWGPLVEVRGLRGADRAS